MPNNCGASVEYAILLRKRSPLKDASTWRSVIKGVLAMADRIGQRFGNYRLVRLIGSGGFADMYLGGTHLSQHVGRH